MEPILAKADNYSFLKKLVENVKQTRDAQAPDDEEVNKVHEQRSLQQDNFFFDRMLLRIWMVTIEVALTPTLVIQIKLPLDPVYERLLVFCSFVFQNLYTVCDLTLGLILNKVDAWFIEEKSSRHQKNFNLLINTFIYMYRLVLSTR